MMSLLLAVCDKQPSALHLNLLCVFLFSDVWCCVLNAGRNTAVKPSGLSGSVVAVNVSSTDTPNI